MPSEGCIRVSGSSDSIPSTNILTKSNEAVERSVEKIVFCRAPT
jgi:hypothetical protein